MTRKKGNVYVVDFFCGAGGFSHGASCAGAHVAIAIDSWDKALKIHEENHPTCTHWHLDVSQFSPQKMGEMVRQELDLGPDDHLHVHTSPPCQMLSMANRKTLNPDQGMELVVWAIDTIAAIAPDSWTLEQVDAKAVRDFLEERKLDYRRVQMADYGVPQNRKRIMAYHNIDFERIDRLYRLTEPVSMERGLGLPDNCGMTQMSSNHDCTRPTSKVAYTVTSVPFYVKMPTDERYRMLTLEEVMALQTFAPSYSWETVKAKTHRQKMLGNAVPPLFARRIIENIRLP